MTERMRLVGESSIALDNLPRTYATRWGALRKAQVVHAVEIGRLRLEEALTRYRLSLEEFRGWQTALHFGGIPGLRAGGPIAPRRPELRLV